MSDVEVPSILVVPNGVGDTVLGVQGGVVRRFSTDFVQEGVGAVARTYSDKVQEVVSVKDFGAVGDGVTDDYPAFVAAIAANAGKSIYVPDPPVEYVIGTAKITLPANTRLIGMTRHVTPVRHGWNGDMFEMGDGSGIENLWLKGDGATYTGRCMVYSGTAGRQSVSGVRASDWDGEIQYYSVSAGSQCQNHDIRFSRRSAGTGTGRYAVVIDPAQQLSAVPRKFSMVETDGTCSFDFGGCNNVQVFGGFVGDLKYTSESRAVALSCLRIANQLSLTIDGHNNTASACDFSPQLTFASGTDANSFQGCTYNNLPIINNSGNGRNLMDHWSVAYTPTLSSGGTAPSLGDGVISASFSCSGNMVSVDIQLTIGSTTSLGTGEIRFSLPTEQPNTNAILQCVGSAVLLRGATTYTAVMQIPAVTQYVRMVRDTSGSVTFNSPATWAAGDIFRLSFSYKK